MYRNTTTGLKFEDEVIINIENAINLKQRKLYSFLKEKGIKWEDYLSGQIIPDECFYFPEKNEIIIYEKKYQKTSGSADEKPQTCDFKIKQFRKLFSSLNVTKVSYIYIFNDWFKKPKYKDMLNYIRSIDGCDYYFYSKEQGLHQ